jgi:fibronectin type 3 domain-containing protein
MLGELEVKVMKANDRYLEIVTFLPIQNDTNVDPGKDLRLQLDRALDVDSVTSDTVKIIRNDQPGVELAFLVNYDSSTRLLKIRPDPYLADSKEYTITISGIRGVDGSRLFQPLVWGFMTGIAPKGMFVLDDEDSTSLAGYTRITTIKAIRTSATNADKWFASTDLSDFDVPTDITGWKDLTEKIDITLTSTQGVKTVYAMFAQLSGVAKYGTMIDINITYDSIAPNSPSVAGTSPTTILKPTWTWSSGGNGGNGNFRYSLDGGSWSAESTVKSYIPTENLNLGNHTLNVQERDNAGNWSANGSRIIGIAPLAPTSIAASDSTSTTQVAVSWTAPSGTILNYYIDRSTSATGTYTQIGTTTAAVTSYNDTSAVAGTIYYYKVRAEGTNNYISAASSYNDGSRKLTAPLDLIATVNTSTAQVTISWTALNGSTRYYVSRATTSGGPYTDLSSYATGTTYNDTTATPGVIYYYKVRSWATYNGETTSGYTLGMRQISAPTGLSASDGTISTGVYLSWTAPPQGTGYRIYRSTSPSSGYSLVATTASNTYTDTGITSTNTKYYYKVEAYGTAGTSYLSDLSVYDVGHRGLTYVTDMTARTYMTGNYIQVSWSALAGATGYMVYQYNSTTYNWDFYSATTSTTVYLAPPNYSMDMHYRICAYDTSTSFPGVMTPSYVTARRLGLNGYWAFNNLWTDTGYADNSYDNFLVTSGSPTFSTTTKRLGTHSAYFYGNSQKITNSKSSFMSADRKKVSVSYWVYPTKLSAGLLWAMACADFNVGFSGTQVTMTISTPSTNSAYATLTLNAWNHIVGTYDGSNIRIYKNGSLVQMTAHAGSSSSGSTALYINSGTSSDYWTGYIDDLRIYDVTLSGSQILDLYNFD